MQSMKAERDMENLCMESKEVCMDNQEYKKRGVGRQAPGKFDMGNEHDDRSVMMHHDKTSWGVHGSCLLFLKGSIPRNPVSLDGARSNSTDMEDMSNSF